MCDAPVATSSPALSPPGASLFGDGRAGDPIAGARSTGEDEPQLDHVPQRHDQREVARARTEVAATLSTRSHEAEAEELLADRAAAVAVADQNSDDEDADGHEPDDRNPLDRP